MCHKWAGGGNVSKDALIAARTIGSFMILANEKFYTIYYHSMYWIHVVKFLMAFSNISIIKARI